ncbi:type II toxin-antitoxin system Phd/YefM family antitoxin [Thalassospira lucentensis]|uniref:type II toxin-antitoxin system Phd/YefM family antitoxin n=1 Tax=Thalassospira lucentensis TaxID=168935 RepID=UPI002942DF5B|nr:type II toxin-antitoxin system Phd/YefM family antitoxin [Thalassospira lucentensis]WOI08939.1 type II toxin-antitoxin system Phd/YefM family antitoxin [Thalassospira lucentensis]
MLEVKSTQLAKEFGAFRSKALVEPISVTTYGRPELVLMSHSEFLRLRRGYREAIRAEDLSEEDLAQIMAATPAEGSEAYNSELEG